jgi:hypothetical protein
MPRHPSPDPGDARGPIPSADEPEQAAPDAGGQRSPGTPSLGELGIVGISRRRIAWAVLALVAAWIVVGFAGQSVEASKATTRVAEERAQNAEVAAQTDALRRELELVTQKRWVLQQARAYQLGSRTERPFALAPDAPALPADAPGSPARRLGADTTPRGPLDSWLEVLFGPAPGG